MCWNSSVSLNTFVFSSFVLLMIMYNNKYTKYKINELNHFWMYMFLFSFIVMQLLEFLMWKNIGNKFYNKIISICIIILIVFIQPLVSLMNINDNDNLRKKLLKVYIFLSCFYALFFYSNYNIHTEITKGKHLNWRITPYNKIFALFLGVIWLFFFLYSFYHNKYWLGLIFGLVTFGLSTYNYFEDKSISSNWCWIVNTIMLFYAYKLLFYLPYKLG